jgi:hypothetical protein
MDVGVRAKQEARAELATWQSLSNLAPDRINISHALAFLAS